MITIHNAKETNFDRNGYGTIDDNIINPLVSWKMNDEFKFSFDYPSNANLSEYLLSENILRVPVPYMPDQLFRIYRPRPILGFIRVEARHIFYDLLTNFIEDTNIVEKIGVEALNQLLNAAVIPHNFQGFSDIQTITNMRIVRYNPIEAILDNNQANTFINRWGGEIYRDNFRIHMRKRLGVDNGLKIEHKKDLLGYDSSIDYSNIITRIMPMGFDGLMLPEKYIDSPLIDLDNPRVTMILYRDVKAAIGDYADDEDAIPLEDAYNELRRLASEEFSIYHVDEPESTFNIDFVSLANTEEYSLFKHIQEVHQGDTVYVNVPEDNFMITARMVGFTSNPLLENYYNELTLGNYSEQLTSKVTSIDTIRQEIQNNNEIVIQMTQAANKKNAIFWGSAPPYDLELGQRPGDLYYQEKGDYVTMYLYIDDNGIKYWKEQFDSEDLTDATFLIKGTLNAANVNVINLNANSIVGGDLELSRGLRITNNGDLVLGIDSQTGKVIFNAPGLEYGSRNLVLHGDDTKVSSDLLINTYTLSRDFKEGIIYTAVLKGQINEGNHFILKQNNGGTDLGLMENIEDDIWKLVFQSFEPEIEYIRLISVYQESLNEDTTIEWLKVVRGDNATLDFQRAPEDTQSEIDSKAPQETVNELEKVVSNWETLMVTKEELGEVNSDMQEYLELLDANSISLEEAKTEIQDLIDRTALIQLNLGDWAAQFSFLDTYIRLADEGLLIQEKEGSTGIRISTDRIDFLDGAGEPVAYITNQTMRINRGIFVESAQIGEHKIETIADGHTIVQWVGEING